MINANADILMLGSMAGPAAAGVYKVATRGAELLTFSLAVISVPLGPSLARLHAAGDKVRLQSEVRRWAWIAFIPAALLAIMFLFKGDVFLGLFGSEYLGEDVIITLSVLTIGQLLHVAAGPVGLLLVMTGHERYAAQSLAVGAFLNVGLNSVLIPVWGIRGAAVATTVSTVLFATLLIVFVKQRLKINPTIFQY